MSNLRFNTYTYLRTHLVRDDFWNILQFLIIYLNENRKQ